MKTLYQILTAMSTYNFMDVPPSLQIRRKEEMVQKMVEVLNRLRGKDPKIPPPTPGVINDKNMARLLGETGPLGDFANGRMLMRYGGLNLRMRQSGKYQG